MPPSISILRAMNTRHLLPSTAILRPQAVPLRPRMPFLAHHLHNPAHPRTSPPPTPHPSNLRNTTTFPAFSSLPSRNTRNTSRVHHWCFLAEIVHLSWFMRLRIDVLDRTATAVPVFLYTPDQGAVLVPDVDEGNTLAVFYAKTHVFADGVLGMRVDDPMNVKVLRYSLNELMDANDKLFSNTCATCQKPVPGTHPHGQIPYCNKTCKTTRDPSSSALRTVSRLLQRDWASARHAGAIHLQPPSPWGKGNPQMGVTDPKVFRALLGMFPPTYQGALKDLTEEDLVSRPLYRTAAGGIIVGMRPPRFR